MSESAPETLLVSGNVVNVYAGPSSSSEMVSQCLMGAEFEAGEEAEGFRFGTTADRYSGWVAATHLVPAWDRSDYLQTGIATLFADVYSAPDAHSEMLTKLAVATRVCVAHKPEVNEFVPIVLADRRVGYVHSVCLNLTHSAVAEQTDLLDPEARRSLDVAELKRRVLRAVGRQAAESAKRFVGTPYLWGGTTPFGLDCSGFVQLAYQLSGVQLLRDAHQQYADRRFRRVDEGQRLDQCPLESGDLITFSRREDRCPTHIGLALGDGRFIHSLGGQGVCIHPVGTPRFMDTFVGAARISPDADLAIDAA